VTREKVSVAWKGENPTARSTGILDCVVERRFARKLWGEGGEKLMYLGGSACAGKGKSPYSRGGGGKARLAASKVTGGKKNIEGKRV